jgi:hypothetical protein
MPLRIARRRLSFAGERALMDRALSKLSTGR